MKLTSQTRSLTCFTPDGLDLQRPDSNSPSCLPCVLRWGRVCKTSTAVTTRGLRTRQRIDVVLRIARGRTTASGEVTREHEREANTSRARRPGVNGAHEGCNAGPHRPIHRCCSHSVAATDSHLTLCFAIVSQSQITPANIVLGRSVAADLVALAFRGMPGARVALRVNDPNMEKNAMQKSNLITRVIAVTLVSLLSIGTIAATPVAAKQDTNTNTRYKYPSWEPPALRHVPGHSRDQQLCRERRKRRCRRDYFRNREWHAVDCVHLHGTGDAPIHDRSSTDRAGSGGGQVLTCDRDPST